MAFVVAKRPDSGNALVPLDRGGDLVDLTALADTATGYARRSLSERTLKEYERCWRKFETWCEKYRLTAMPAQPETVAMYVGWLAAGHGKQKPLAISSINQAIAAIKRAHSWRGHQLDTADPRVQRVWAGARREIAKTRTIRRVSPVMETDLREILQALLGSASLRESRDAAILALGFGAALRRSELVGLDWWVLGDGTGFLSIDDRGLLVTLMTSKASQAAAEEVIVPRTHATMLCTAVEDWIELSKVERGTPLFRPIVGNTIAGHHVSTERLNARTVPDVVKRRAYELCAERNKGARKKLSAKDLKAKVAQFSGHSMRVGHVTSAAERGVIAAHIQATSRHKTPAMISTYTRVTDAVKNSSLKGSDL